MNNEKKEYIDGIFNYCDRWCEKCEFTANCKLFNIESKIQTHQILNDGELPEAKVIFDMETDDEEPGSEFEDDDLGFEDEVSEFDFGEDKDESNLLKSDEEKKEYQIENFAEDYLDKASSLLKTIGENPIISKPGLSEEEFEEVKHLFDNLEIISFYPMFILAKIKRALDGKDELEIGLDDEENKFESYDMNGSAKIASIAVEKSLKALTSLFLILEMYSSEIEELMVLLGKILNCLDQEFPGYKNFKRPGFDT